MSEEFIKRDKTKAFKASAETIEKVEELIKKSGKGPTEYFEELVSDLAIQNIVHEDNEEISADLRKHFESDVQKLKNATNSIVSIFTSQMQNISVEKNQWQATTEKKLNEKQEEIEKLSGEYKEIKEQLDEGKLELTELTKVNQASQKEIDVLSKRSQDQEQMIQDRNEKIEDFQERINKLNENIVAKDEELKAVEPMKKELSATKQEVQSLKQEKAHLTKKHNEEMKKQKDELIFTCQKEKHELESSLKNGFIEEKEKIRDEVSKKTEERIKEFYLDEIKRKEIEFDSKENDLKAQMKQKESEAKANEDNLKAQIKKLQEQLQTSAPKKTATPRTNKKQEE